MAQDMHKKPFKAHTMLKLNIFRDSFKEWFPVFLHEKHVEKIYIYDLFAGSGQDADGVYGSPLILLEESIGENGIHCKAALQNKKDVYFAYNEYIEDKANQLNKNISDFFEKCKVNCNLNQCPYEHKYFIKHQDFRDLFKNKKFLSILNNKTYSKYILMDQYGFKHITPNVFKHLVDASRTDFIFFIASSNIRRFQDTDAVKKYLVGCNFDFLGSPKQLNREIVRYFRSIVPKNKEFYLHQFTIKHKSNYYGLIFGTAHSLGMEKFLKVCWKHDPMSGEASEDCNIDNDFEPGTIFFDKDNTNKKESVKRIITDEIFSGKIVTNIEGLKIALHNGCRPCIFVEVINELLKKNKVRVIEGEFNKLATKIHKVNPYKFEVIK